MSYHRGEPYVWSDDADMHLWSNLREGETRYASAVRIDLATFDEIVIQRFCELVRSKRTPLAIVRFADSLGSIFEGEMMAAYRAKPEGE